MVEVIANIVIGLDAMKDSVVAECNVLLEHATVEVEWSTIYCTIVVVQTVVVPQTMAVVRTVAPIVTE